VVILKINSEMCKHLHIGGKNDVANYVVGDIMVNPVHEERDVGVVVGGSLEFHTHISEKVKKATSMMAIIRRTFENLDKEIYLPLYKSLVRSQLEYASSVWCPYKVKYVEKIERVQRRATKLIPGIKNMSYKDRLRKLCLPTLKFRRYRGDMIQVYKLVQEIYDVTVEPIFQLWKNRYETRGNSLKLYPRSCMSEKRKNLFYTPCGKIME